MAIKILAVDDEPQFERLLRQRFRRKLKAGDYELLFASQGKAALSILEADETIDLLMTDINMPEMDGLTLINELKKIRPNLKTIVVSAYGDLMNIRKAMNLGAFDFVTKPIDFADLEKTIEKTIEQSALIRKGVQAVALEEENEYLSEIDALKNQFFTNISHEFRTPLTVIKGMVEQIEEDQDRWLKHGLQMIRKHSDHLLDLVNQVLDLRKLEAGKLPVNWVLGDIIAYLNYLLESFKTLAEAKDIHFNLEHNVPEMEMDYDPEKILRIFSNLWSNAIKFTPEGGQIITKVHVLEGQLIISLEDSGKGIPADQLPDIFKRFYQVRNDAMTGGTGIGLAIVKEMVELMGGQIEVSSQVDVGTKFTLNFPIHQEAEHATDSLEASLKEVDTNQNEVPLPFAEANIPDLPQILIVEDNTDVANYIGSILEGRYQIKRAVDGQAGLDYALEQVPDLIISDVMMPRMDGIEMCDLLKKDERTSHIPIVLLTAKADVSARMEGLKSGADQYLAKPFNKKELLLRIEKLLELRKQLQRHYLSLIEQPGPAEDPSPEHEFIAAIKQAIEAELDNESFGIPEICRSIGVSRSQLHRKLKALTGLSTSHFIRSVRLHKAKHFLAHTDLNIAQVAYEVGFKDPKYFSKTFAEVFGQAPSDWRKQR
ncbi:MAG: hypothetical protein Sapg2KO_34440 [Saprospiraceae bacterium]